MRQLAIFCLTVGLLSCGGAKTPTAPTPVPVTPLPALTLGFTPEAQSTAIPIAGLRLSLVPVGPATDALTVSVRIASGDKYLGTKALGIELWWDSAVLAFDTWAKGDWLEQGSLVEWHVGLVTPGQLSIVGIRPTTVGAVRGDGELMQIRLKPAPGVRSGSSRLQWNAPQDFNGILQALAGTITIQ